MRELHSEEAASILKCESNGSATEWKYLFVFRYRLENEVKKMLSYVYKDSVPRDWPALSRLPPLHLQDLFVKTQPPKEEEYRTGKTKSPEALKEEREDTKLLRQFFPKKLQMHEGKVLF